MEPIPSEPPTPPTAVAAAETDVPVAAGGAGGEVTHTPAAATLDTKFVEATRCLGGCLCFVCVAGLQRAYCACPSALITTSTRILTMESTRCGQSLRAHEFQCVCVPPLLHHPRVLRLFRKC